MLKDAEFTFGCFGYQIDSSTLIAVFLMFKYVCLSENKIITTLSKYSFGAYLVHALVIEKLNEWFGLNTLSFYPGLSVPIISFLVFIISYAISAVLHLIPVVRNYCV